MQKATRQPLVPINTIEFPRCGAKSKRTGMPCKGSAMKNGRCRFHGGRSTGPTTQEGLERMKAAKTRHGEYTQEARLLRKLGLSTIQEAQAVLKQALEAGGFLGNG